MTLTETQPLLPDGSARDHAAHAAEDDLQSSSSTTSDCTHDGRRFSIALALQLAAVVFNFAITGVAQSSIGAMIPDIEKYYNLRNGPTAIIFAAVLVGYLFAVSLIQQVHLRFGRRGVAFIGPLLRFSSASVLLFGPPFSVALCGYLLFGISLGFTDAGFSAWASNLPYSNIVLGLMNGAWSSGCVFGPQLVVLMARRHLPWFSLYGILACASCLELLALGVAFTKDDAAHYQAFLGEHSSLQYNPLRSKETWMCGLFWFIYVGIESSYGDWIVTYMVRVRHVDRSTAAGAASSFWTGMLFGRLALAPITEFCGLQASVTAYILLSIIAQAFFKSIDSVVSQLSILAAVGFLFGPFFPSAVVLMGKKLPPFAHVGAVSAAAAMGQIGGSACPLIVGFMADAFGIARLIDVATVLTISLIISWIAFCRLK